MHAQSVKICHFDTNIVKIGIICPNMHMHWHILSGVGSRGLLMGPGGGPGGEAPGSSRHLKLFHCQELRIKALQVVYKTNEA